MMKLDPRLSIGKDGRERVKETARVICCGILGPKAALYASNKTILAAWVSDLQIFFAAFNSRKVLEEKTEAMTEEEIVPVVIDCGEYMVKAG